MQPPPNTDRRANSSRSARSSRSWRHSIVARSVCWRGSASRPPLSRSSRCRAARGSAPARARRSRSSELDRERQIVQPRHSSRDSPPSGSSPSASAEQLHCLRLGQRRHRILRPRREPQQLAARDEQAQIRARPEQHRRAPAPHPPPARSCRAAAAARARRCASASPLLRAERLRDRLDHERRIAQRREPDPEHPRLELRHELRGRLDRQPRLPRAARTGQRHEPRAVPHQRRDLRDLRSRPTNDDAGRGRFVFEIVFSGGNASGAELEQTHRLVDVLQAVLAEIAKLVPSTSSRVARERSTCPPWPALDPRRRVHVRAHVALGGHDRARPCAHPCGPGSGRSSSAAQRLRRRRHRLARRRRTHTKNASPCVSTSTRRGARTRRARPGGAPRARRAYASCPDLVQQPGRALDVGEQQRHRPGRLLDHPRIFCQRADRSNVARRNDAGAGCFLRSRHVVG